jgi:hypothetical protein
MAFLKGLILCLLTVGSNCVGFGQPASSQHPLTSSAVHNERPNIVLILTDDQDLHMNSLDYVPLIKEHLIDRGTLFRRHFCTTAICCPSRVTLLTGKAAHNTNVTDVFPPYGKYLTLDACHLLFAKYSNFLLPQGVIPSSSGKGITKTISLFSFRIWDTIPTTRVNYSTPTPSITTIIHSLQVGTARYGYLRVRRDPKRYRSDAH